MRTADTQKKTEKPTGGKLQSTAVLCNPTPEASILKLCKKCVEEKPLIKFSHSKYAPDGLQWWCKSCLLVADRAWRKLHPEKAVEKRAYLRQYHVTHRRQNLIAVKAFQASRGKNAMKVHSRLWNYILRGKFPRASACSRKDDSCVGRIEWAHIDYSRWDNVISLCASHHRRFDKQNPKTPMGKS